MLLNLLRFLSKPHKSVVNPITKQVCSFTALIHIFSLPVPLTLFYIRYGESQFESAFTPHVHIAGTLFILLSYLVLRSPFFRVSFAMQVAASALIPMTFSLLVPSIHNAPQIIVISVILAAIFFNQKVIVITTLLCDAGLLALLFISGEEEKLLISKTMVTLNMSAMLVYFLRGHISWLTRYRDTAFSAQLERYRHLASSSFDGIATLEQGLLTEVSDGFAAVFRLKPNQCLGRSLSSLIPEFQIEDSQLETFAVGSMENDAVTQYICMAVNKIDKERHLVAVRDVTGERLAQIQQLQMDRMTATGTLASGIAHELNTPLMVAMNQTRIAQTELTQKKLSDVNQRLSILDDVIGQIARIVSDLKWYVQSNADEESMRPTPVIENAVRLAKHRVKQHAKITLDLHADTPPVLPTHALIQLVTNLLFNAADAKKPDQNSIQINVKTWQESNYFCFRVTDDGIGMSAATRNRIFEPFYTFGKTGGSGLGLSICASLVARVSGNIDVESRLGRGCSVTIRLPLAIESSPTPSAHLGTKGIHTLLVIDDDPELPVLIAEILTEFDCIFADDVEKALHLLTNRKVDAVLCDVNMPCGGASQLHRELLKLHHPLASKMVIITGGVVNLEMQSFVESTLQPVVYKPFRAQQINEALSRLSIGATG